MRAAQHQSRASNYLSLILPLNNNAVGQWGSAVLHSGTRERRSFKTICEAILQRIHGVTAADPEERSP